MAWVIASIPLWALGALFLVGGIVCLFDKDENSRGRAQLFLVGMFGSAILLALAAAVAS